MLVICQHLLLSDFFKPFYYVCRIMSFIVFAFPRGLVVCSIHFKCLFALHTFSLVKCLFKPSTYLKKLAVLLPLSYESKLQILDTNPLLFSEYFIKICVLSFCFSQCHLILLRLSFLWKPGHQLLWFLCLLSYSRKSSWGGRTRRQRSKRSCSPSPQTHHKTTSPCKTTRTEHQLMLAEGLEPPKRARNSWQNWVEPKGKREREGIRTGPAFLMGSCEGEKEPTLGSHLTAERSAQSVGPQRHWEKHGSWTHNSTAEWEPHRSSEIPAQIPQPETLGQGLCPETQALEVSPGERTGDGMRG